MTTVYPDAACLRALREIIDEDLLFVAYTNDVDPDEDSVLADFDVSANLSHVVAEADWTIQQVTAHVATVMAAPVPLVNGDVVSVQIYGVICIDDATNLKLFQATRLDGAPITLEPGDAIPWLPMLSSLWSH